MHIKEAKTLNVGAKLDDVVGVLTEIRQTRKFATGHVQTVRLADLNDPETSMIVKLWNAPEIPAGREGRPVRLQGKMSIKEDAWKGRKYTVLSVDGDVKITEGDAALEEDDIPMGEAAQPTQPKPVQAKETGQSLFRETGTWKALAAQMDRYGALYTAAFAQVIKKIKPEIHARLGHNLSDEDIRQLATTLFIEFKGHSFPTEPWAGYGSQPQEPEPNF